MIHQSNFVVAIASYLHLLNSDSIKTNTTMQHVLQFFLTGKQKLHEMTCQPWSLGSFTFQKGWIGGQESAFKKETRKEP